MCGVLELNMLQPEAAYRLHSSAGTCKLHGVVLPTAVSPTTVGQLGNRQLPFDDGPQITETSVVSTLQRIEQWQISSFAGESDGQSKCGKLQH